MPGTNTLAYFTLRK